MDIRVALEAAQGPVSAGSQPPTTRRNQHTSGLGNAIAEALGTDKQSTDRQEARSDGGLGTSGSRRAKLWQIEARHYCSLLGICLGLDELRQLAEKLGIPTTPPLSDYQLHHRFLHIAGAGDKHSRRLHRYVETKFSAAVRAFASVRGAEDLEQAWRTRAPDDLAGAYWAVLTHPSLTPALGNEALERVHMVSHTAAAQIRQVQISLHHERERVRDLEHQVTHERAARTRLIKRYRTLRKQLTDLTRRTTKEVAATHSAGNLVSKVAESSAEKVARLEAKLAQAEHESATWRRLYRQHTQDRLTSNGQTKEGQRSDAETAGDDTDVPVALPCAAPEAEPLLSGSEDNSIDLAGRRIICVGGRGHVIPQLRELTERLNGRFLHHDGGIEDRRGILDESIAGADVVVVALECVSHDATRRLKRRCRRLGTQIVWMRRASAAAFEEALRTHAVAMVHAEAAV